MKHLALKLIAIVVVMVSVQACVDLTGTQEPEGAELIIENASPYTITSVDIGFCGSFGTVPFQEAIPPGDQEVILRFDTEDDDEDCVNLWVRDSEGNTWTKSDLVITERYVWTIQ